MESVGSQFVAKNLNGRIRLRGQALAPLQNAERHGHWVPKSFVYLAREAQMTEQKVRQVFFSPFQTCQNTGGMSPTSLVLRDRTMIELATASRQSEAGQTIHFLQGSFLPGTSSDLLPHGDMGNQGCSIFHSLRKSLVSSLPNLGWQRSPGLKASASSWRLWRRSFPHAWNQY